MSPLEVVFVLVEPGYGEERDELTYAGFASITNIGARSFMVAMANPRLVLCWVAVLFFFCAPEFCTAWKEAEFRKCHESKFCKEVRERAAAWARGESNREIEVKDVKLSDGRLMARLVSGGNEEEAFVMELSTYRDGIVRVKVVEETAPRKRFELPDVVVNDFEQKRVGVSRIGKRSGASVVQLSGGHDVIIQHKPFQVSDYVVSFSPCNVIGCEFSSVILDSQCDAFLCCSDSLAGALSFGFALRVVVFIECCRFGYCFSSRYV